jgi:phosphoribosylaminoimidazole carboxylase PurE protein
MKNKIQIAILMGSDSDLPIMKEAAEILDKFNVGYEIKVASAHRTPKFVMEYVTSAYKKGVRVIIAGAGGAAHLPGIIAAYFPLPVIGVPIKGKYLEGMDSLLSIVQMPGGVPVAAVAVNGAKNAGLLALQILSISDEDLLKKLISYKKNMADEVIRKNDNLNI